MSSFNRRLAKLFPAFALKREIAQRRLTRLDRLGNGQKRTNTFDSISGDRLRYDFLSTNGSADSALQSSEHLRYHVRRLEYNNGQVSGPIRRIVSNVVGAGFKFQSLVVKDEYPQWEPFPAITDPMAEQFNYQAEKAWERWTPQADKRLLLHFWELVALCEGALLRDGEVLVILRESTRSGRIIPLCLEVLEIDHLQTPLKEVGNPRIRNGIRFDEEGVPVSYFILKEHPGETLFRQGGRRFDDYDEVPAFFPDGTRKVIHLYNPARPGQSRGFAQFAAGLKALQDLDRYEEAEIYARLEDACLTGIVTSPAPLGFQEGVGVATVNADGDDTGSGSQPVHEFAPGKWNHLLPGEEVTIHNPTRANNNMDVFTNHLLRSPANAIDCPPEVYSQNWGGMNYSNARTVLLQFYRSCRERQRFLVNHLCLPVHEIATKQFVARGLIRALGFDRRKDAYLRHGWTLPGWAWVDPQREAKGTEIDLQNNLTTITATCAERGDDAYDVLETRAKELQKMKQLEEKYGVKFPQPSGASTAVQDEGPEGGEDKDTSAGLRRVK